MGTEKPKRVVFDSRLIAERDYWLERLSSARFNSTLKPDFERPVPYPGSRKVIAATLPQELIQNLVRISKDLPFLLYTILMAGLKICLYKYTDNESMTIGSPMRRQENESLRSDNALAILDTVAPNLSFREFLSNVRANLTEAYSNQNYPCRRLVSDLGLSDDNNKCALFDVALVLKNIHHELPDLKNHLTITFERTSQDITAIIEYESTAFKTETVARLMGHYTLLLGQALENADRPVNSLNLLSADERRQILTEWNDSHLAFPQRCVHHLFEAIAAESPDAVAVVYKHEHVTYAELNRRANQLAHCLETLGVGPEMVVGICLNPSPELIVAMLAILKAGGAYLPIDPAIPPSRGSYMLADAGARLLLTNHKLLTSLPQSEVQTICLDADQKAIEKCRTQNPATVTELNNLAYVIYTSGSTGQPKGVQVEHRGLCNTAQAQVVAFHIEPATRLLQFASIGFDASVSEVFTALVCGATLCLEDRETIYSPQTLVPALQDLGITTVTLPPALLAVTSPDGCSGVSTLVAAGESCSAAIVERWSTGRHFINAYGPTEATVCASLWECKQPADGPPPIGRPLANAKVFLFDRQQQLVPAGVPGELYVGGAGVARGYSNRPDLTAEKFLPDPFSASAGARMYRTGDNARYRSDGDIEFLGRLDHQVKIRGYRIELGEVEAVLNDSPAVQASVVISEKNSGGDARLLAYLIPAVEIPNVADLRAFLKERLPEYMVPSHFVMLSEFPLNSSGKVDRNRLASMETPKPVSRAEFEAPRTESEQMLADIWKEVLGISEVGIHDNFFDLGGHSILVAQVASRVTEVMQVDLPVRTLFEAPTVAALNLAILKSQAVQVESADLAEILNELDQLSDEEAELSLIKENESLAEVTLAEPRLA
jgi:amino acid adenylation domain-containing protein